MSTAERSADVFNGGRAQGTSTPVRKRSDAQNSRSVGERQSAWWRTCAEEGATKTVRCRVHGASGNHANKRQRRGDTADVHRRLHGRAIVASTVVFGRASDFHRGGCRFVAARRRRFVHRRWNAHRIRAERYAYAARDRQGRQHRCHDQRCASTPEHARVRVYPGSCSPHVLAWIGVESGFAGRRTEIVRLAVVLARSSCIGGIDLHPANRISFHLGAPCRYLPLRP